MQGDGPRRSRSRERRNYLTFVRFTIHGHVNTLQRALKLSFLGKSTCRQAGGAASESWWALAGAGKFWAFHWQPRKRGELEGDDVEKVIRKHEQPEASVWTGKGTLENPSIFKEATGLPCSGASLQHSARASAKQICHKWLTSGRTNPLTSPAEQTQSCSN